MVCDLMKIVGPKMSHDIIEWDKKNSLLHLSYFYVCQKNSKPSRKWPMIHLYNVINAFVMSIKDFSLMITKIRYCIACNNNCLHTIQDNVCWIQHETMYILSTSCDSHSCDLPYHLGERSAYFYRGPDKMPI